MEEKKRKRSDNRHQTPVSRLYQSRDVALIAVFAGLYLGYGYVSSVTLRSITRSTDLFFLIAVLFTVLAYEVRQSWSATLLGTISGVIFLGTPAPFALHIAASIIANGLVFDLYLRLMNRRTTPPSRVHVVTGATIGNLVMAIVGLSALQAVGTILPWYIWAAAIVIDTLVGGLGALFGIAIVRRLRVLTRTLPRSLSVESSSARSGQALG